MRGASLHTRQPARMPRVFFVVCIVIAGSMLVCLLLQSHFYTGVAAAPLQQETGPESRTGELVLTTVDNWQQGLLAGLLVSNNNGGELRLDTGEFEGSFLSDPFAASFDFNAAGAYWNVDLPVGTDISLAIRGRSTPPGPGDTASSTGWGPWYPLVAADARTAASDGAFATPDVIAFPADTRYLQVRVLFDSTRARASAELQDITIAYLDTTQGPVVPAGLPRVPASDDDETLTAAPLLVSRQTWSASPVMVRPQRVAPRGIVLHQIDVTTSPTETLPLLRALTTYQTDVLGWEDLSYHYIIDEEGILYEGRAGGPSAAVSRLAAGDSVIHVALLGDVEDDLDEPVRATLTSLLAWLGEAYDIPPLGEHPVLVENRRETRENIVAHSQIVPEAPDPGEPLRDILSQLRGRADEATIRSRWYFTEGNNVDYSQQLSLVNFGEQPAEAVIKLFPENIAEPVERNVSLAANGRAEFSLTELVSQTTDLPIVVESNADIIANQIIGLPTDIDSGPGAANLSRVWYFAEGSTRRGFNTFLIMYNPADTPTNVTLTYMRSDGTRFEQEAVLAPKQRLAINVGDVLPPEASFGTRIVATQPIVAERTMRFGADDIGLHSNAGITELSRTWYFAEGTTQNPFNMRLLLLNPNQQDTIASVTYMTPDGTEATRRYAIPANTRLEVDVNEFVPELGIATIVDSDRPIAAERALYFSPILTGTQTITPTEDTAELRPDVDPLVGTISAGATEPAFSWRFADASTVNTNQFLLLSNPGRSQARVTVDLVLFGAEGSTETIIMPAGSRFTLPIHEIYPDAPAVGVVVQSTQRIVAERSLFPEDGIGSGGGSTAMGIPGD